MIDASAFWIRMGVFWGGLVFFLLLELLIPYRPPTVSKLWRWVKIGRAHV